MGPSSATHATCATSSARPTFHSASLRKRARPGGRPATRGRPTSTRVRNLGLLMRPPRQLVKLKQVNERPISTAAAHPATRYDNIAHLRTSPSIRDPSRWARAGQRVGAEQTGPVGHTKGTGTLAAESHLCQSASEMRLGLFVTALGLPLLL